MADLDDGFSVLTVKRASADEILCLAGILVALALCDLAREDDVFEVVDREAVIFKLISSVG